MKTQSWFFRSLINVSKRTARKIGLKIDRFLKLLILWWKTIFYPIFIKKIGICFFSNLCIRLALANLTDTGEDSKLLHRRTRPKVDTLCSSFFPTRPSDDYDSAPSRKYSRPLLDVFACIGYVCSIFYLDSIRIRTLSQKIVNIKILKFKFIIFKPFSGNIPRKPEYDIFHIFQKSQIVMWKSKADWTAFCNYATSHIHALVEKIWCKNFNPFSRRLAKERLKPS